MMSMYLVIKFSPHMRFVLPSDAQSGVLYDTIYRSLSDTCLLNDI